MVVGVYGSWVTVRGSGVPGTADGNRGWVVLALALLAGAVFWFRRGTRSAGVYAAAAGAGALAAAAYDRTHLGQLLGGSSVVSASAGAGWGLDLAFFAALSLALAGAAWATMQQALPWAWLAPSASPPPERPSAIDLAVQEDLAG